MSFMAHMSRNLMSELIRMYHDMRGSRKFCQRGSNTEFVLVDGMVGGSKCH